MRRLGLLLALAACGDDGATVPDAQVTMPDASGNCQPISAVGTLYRRQPNPRLIAGQRVFAGGARDTAITDPDLRWSEDEQRWHVYYASPHGTAFDPPGPGVIRHGTSSDLATWTLDDTPSLALAASGWDSARIDAPSVIYNPSAPADRRYLMLYAGAAGNLPGAALPAYQIGAAFSADGRTFTRVPASESPHGETGLVFKPSQVYPGAVGAYLTDPEIVLVGGVYHLWFSSYACTGTSCATVTASGVGYATSTDGVNWTNVESPVRTLLRASVDPTTGGLKPTAVYDAVYCRWELWLSMDMPSDTSSQSVVLANTAGLYYATSSNARTWQVNYLFTRDFQWNASASGEHLGMRAGADIAQRSTGRYLVYVGYDDQNVPAGSTLPTASGTRDGVMTLNLASRDAPP